MITVELHHLALAILTIFAGGIALGILAGGINNNRK